MQYYYAFKNILLFCQTNLKFSIYFILIISHYKKINNIVYNWKFEIMELKIYRQHASATKHNSFYIISYTWIYFDYFGWLIWLT